MRRHVFLVRHCQSEANAEGRIEGRGDSPLSPRGREQAERVAAFVANRALGDATLLASSQTRAIQTAGAIAAACGWVASHDHRIREGDLGWMEGISYTEVGRHMREKQARELDADLHGGESLEVVGQRMWDALEAALATSDNVLVMVSHGYAIQALLRRLDPDVSLPRFISNGDVVEVWLDDGAMVEPPVQFPLEVAESGPGR